MIERAADTPPKIEFARYGLPEDIAGVVIYLASKASGFVCGAVIPVDGGYAHHGISAGVRPNPLTVSAEGILASLLDAASWATWIDIRARRHMSHKPKPQVQSPSAPRGSLSGLSPATTGGSVCVFHRAFLHDTLCRSS
jgi:Enoyl-(Acyl carrier protein) reductase